MADPFTVLGTVGATIGIIDVTVRLGQSLKKTLAAAPNATRDLADLYSQVETLISINNRIKGMICAPEFSQSLDTLTKENNPLEELWKELWLDTRRISGECQRVLEKIEALIKDIQGLDRDVFITESDPNEQSTTVQSKGRHAGALRTFGRSATKRFSDIRVQLRKESKDEDFKTLRQQLANSQNALETCLAVINLGWTMKSQNITGARLQRSSDDIASFMTDIKEQISSLQQAATPEPEFSNKHFQAPTASPLFTGMKVLLDQVEDAFGLVSYPFADSAVETSKSSDNLVPYPSPSITSTAVASTNRSPSGYGRMQKRFVIFGLGGSGKTEFCRKFAERNQPRFWGVFWIDASSDETAQHSFKEIAQIGGVDTNINAAKTWLSSLERPWLLVIDNADDPNIPVERYFPGGERGHILVTTRNPFLKNFGTVGEGSCELERLEEDDAVSLLLKQAQEPSPWNSSARLHAAQIARVLGYLPLALVYTGKAIAKGLTTLEDCVNYFDNIWDSIRLESKRSGHVVEEAGKSVFAPYDAMYQDLDRQNTQSARDAIELLKLFSFLHHENIRIDFITKAAKNSPATEARLRHEYEEKEHGSFAHGQNTVIPQPKPWGRRIGEWIVQVVAQYQDRGYPTLPVALRDDNVNSFSVHRLRTALSILTQMSLIIHRRMNDQDVYSMHPLVHRWVRERPQMSIGERGLWCQAAITMLNQCVPLPPLGGADSDLELRRHLLPHLDYVQKFQKEIQANFEKNQRTRILPFIWLLRTPSIDRAKALQFAKFSRVYSECGRFQDAEMLQVKVKNYLTEMLGLEDERTTLIMLALSGTYWQLSRINEATALLNQALEICTNSLGPSHHRTLKVMDELGRSQCFRGRFKEALKLHQDALSGMERILPPDHTDIFLAMDNLGVVNHRYFRYTESKELHSQAVTGLTKNLGSTHQTTLLAKENLAMAYLEMGGEFLDSALKVELEVLEQRRNKLGKENPYTLWAICNLARIKSALGRMDEAEREMRATLPIAIRNLGENHFGTLSGKTHLAQVLVRQKRYDEAKEIFKDVIQRSRYEAGTREEGEHPDQIMAMWYAAQLHQLCGNFEEAMHLLEIVSGSLSLIGGTLHPFAKKLANKMEDLRCAIAQKDARLNSGSTTGQDTEPEQERQTKATNSSPPMV